LQSGSGERWLARHRLLVLPAVAHPHHDGEDRQQDDHADDRPEDPAEVEDLVVADAQADGENQVAQQGTSQAKAQGNRSRPWPAHVPEDVSRGQHSPGDPRHEAEADGTDHVLLLSNFYVGFSQRTTRRGPD
jgi:hypothetical protein